MEQCFCLWASESVRVCDLAHTGGGRVVTPKWGQSGLLLSRDLPFRCAGLFLRQLAEGNGFNDSAAHSASARALKWPVSVTITRCWRTAKSWAASSGARRAARLSLEVGERPQRQNPTRCAWKPTREAAMAVFAKSWRCES